MTTYRDVVLSCVGALLVTGCVPRMEPVGVSVDRFAFTEDQGVRLWASGSSWEGRPARLAELMTPVLVTLENTSGRQLRLTPADLTLEGSTGMHYAAVPPLLEAEKRSERERTAEVVFADYHPAVPVQPREPQPQPQPQPRPMPGPRPQPQPRPRPQVHTPTRFWVVQPWVQYHATVPIWPAAWPWWDVQLRAERYRTWPVQLPSDDMIRRALPEGVLDDGGTVSGFVYFPRLAGSERAVNLEVSLTDATTGEQWGVVRLPFAVR